jgi:hypothetical protein
MPYATRLVAVAAAAALAATAAQAFDANKGFGGKHRPDDAPKGENSPKQSKERESAYRNALKNIPDGKANKDPWAGAR